MFAVNPLQLGLDCLCDERRNFDVTIVTSYPGDDVRPKPVIRVRQRDCEIQKSDRYVADLGHPSVADNLVEGDIP